MEAQGGMFNIAEINNLASDWMGIPELKRCISFTAPPSEEAASPSSSVKPPNTSRTYNRSIPSGTAQGAGQVMQQQWASMANSNGGASMAPAG